MGNGGREGKKDKIVISKLSHALRQSSNMHLRAQGSLAKLGG